MWVGEKFYTPDSFRVESKRYGVSKRIADIPSWLVLGETWVFLAHPKYPVLKHGLAVDHKPAIFSAFKPDRVEVPLWTSLKGLKEHRELEEKGYTIVWFEGPDSDHL